MRIDEDIIVTGGRMLVALCCVAGAMYLAYHEKPSWGWLLTVAVLFGLIHVAADDDDE